MLKKVLETLLKTSQSAQFQTASTNRPKVRQGFYKYFFFTVPKWLKFFMTFWDLSQKKYLISLLISMLYIHTFCTKIVLNLKLINWWISPVCPSSNHAALLYEGDKSQEQERKGSLRLSSPAGSFSSHNIQHRAHSPTDGWWCCSGCRRMAVPIYQLVLPTYLSIYICST